MFDDALWAIHSDLPREGPGNDASTLRALAMMEGLPSEPAILDIGCGPGAQTLALARAGARVTAVDLHQPYLDEVKRRARAAGLADRISPRRASMFDLPFEPESFDALWCEGALYIMGFSQGLTAWRPLLKPGGYLAVTEACFLKPKSELPEALLTAWASYPAMTTAEKTLALVEPAGFRALGSFVLPEVAWWEDYYGPIEAKLPALRQAHGDKPAFVERIAETQAEIDNYRRWSDLYGYVFIVMRRA